VDIENNFNPIYAVTPDKKKVVAELKKAAKDKTVWLASDEDREGEAIAWHLTQALGLDPKKTNRIVFHEITKTALEQAIKTPRTIDLNLVDAQQARRVLDRLVGYELSPVLWKKIRAGLSAGRVQSVAVRIVVDREKEIKNFKSEATYKVTAIFSKDNDQFNAELTERLKSQDLAKQTLEQLIGATFNISNIIKKPSFKSPSAPFTTSTLQQEASRRLGFSVKQTMIVAQRLYESGKITYMRTDSTSLSELALKTAEEYIIKNYGKDYHERKQFQTKNSSAQEAHEAIRPTDFNDTSAGEDDQQTKLYKLIWQRALSSQMSKANTEKTEVSIANDKSKSIFLAKGEILVFPGFMAVYTGR
ncbi:type I DNA topoisomerase, partial [bacterium]|nr:type I DNA topoisomerase [bacterium]